MKCGSGQYKLTVCATKERYIIRNGIRQQSHSVLRDYSGFVHFSYEDPVRLGMQIAFGRVRRKTAPLASI